MADLGDPQPAEELGDDAAPGVEIFEGGDGRQFAFTTGSSD